MRNQCFGIARLFKFHENSNDVDMQNSIHFLTFLVTKIPSFLLPFLHPKLDTAKRPNIILKWCILGSQNRPFSRHRRHTCFQSILASILHRFWSHFGTPRTPPGPLKSLQIAGFNARLLLGPFRDRFSTSKWLPKTPQGPHSGSPRDASGPKNGYGQTHDFTTPLCTTPLGQDLGLDRRRNRKSIRSNPFHC